jgi:NAD(P)H-nitrite reductase large subunit
MKYVIIGNGIAGVNAAEAIRRMDPDGRIVMIGDETFPPYCRPMISMVLEGSVPHAKLPIRPAAFYDEWKIEPVLGTRVKGMDVDANRLDVDGRSVFYDRLLIATGADPRPIKARGLELGNIFYMRTERQVQQMLAALPGARRALVLGGGLVGFKAAYGLMRRGLAVTMLIRSGYPLSMQVDSAAGGLILDELTAHGLDVRVDIAAEAFEGQQKVQAAQLSDGRRLECDLVIIGKGVLPALGFVDRDRLTVDLGLVVDQFLQTSMPHVFAAGDAAESIDVARETRWVNAIWPEAAAQGRIAGINMAGRPVPYTRSLSRNVIRIFDLDVMTAGAVDPTAVDGADVLTRFDRAARCYRQLVFRGDRLVGMTLVNAIEQGGVLTALIQNHIPVAGPRERLLEPHFNYRSVA